MINKFIITGLPRSRTAWFSAFMTASGYPCLHEGLNGCNTLDEYREKVRNVSDSNTGYAYVGQVITDRPTLIVHRYKHDTPKDITNNLRSLNGLHVLFDEIDERIEEIFIYLTGDQINHSVYNLFKDLNITTMKKMDFEAAKALLNETS